METSYPGMPENIMQILLMEKFAADHKVPLANDVVEDWIATFSEKFRAIFKGGERNIEAIEERLYVPQFGSNYGEMIDDIIAKIG